MTYSREWYTEEYRKLDIDNYNSLADLIAKYNSLDVKYYERFKLWFHDIRLSGKLLELGFNLGRYVYYLVNKYPSVVIDALDWNDSLNKIIPYIKEMSPRVHDLFLCDCRTILKPNAHYDYITSIDFFEHLPFSVYIESVKECHRVLKKGGTLFVFLSLCKLDAHINRRKPHVIIKDIEPLGFKKTGQKDQFLCFTKC